MKIDRRKPSGDQNKPTDSPTDGRPEMARCPRCGRANPTARFDCLYCGAALERADLAVGSERFVIKKPEIWERGFNVIILPAAEAFDVKALSASVAAFGIAADLMERASKSAVPFPLCRVSSRPAADLISERLAAGGVKCGILEDEKLEAQRPPVRLRSARFADSHLCLEDFNTGKIFEISCGERIIGVFGRLFTSTIEQTGRRKKDAEQKPEITATSRDTAVLDIFVSDDHRGFRIRSDGFDFSNLGSNVSFLAEENMGILLRRLNDLFPNAKIDSTYETVASDLTAVWPAGVSVSSRGIYRTGFGVRFSKGETTDNLDQFTRYSRMLSFYL